MKMLNKGKPMSIQQELYEEVDFYQINKNTKSKNELIKTITNITGTYKGFISLLSTGLDSPIASYLMMRKGYTCYALSFSHNLSPNSRNIKKVRLISKHLHHLTERPIILFVVDYDPILDYLKEFFPDKLRCILCKRTMLDIASIIADELNALFIVTGEILGEQASQTLKNIYTTDKITNKLPIIRPLIGLNKLDIIDLSRSLGFYDISLMEEDSCTYNPQYPETMANYNEIIYVESRLDRNTIRQKILKNVKVGFIGF